MPAKTETWGAFFFRCPRFYEKKYSFSLLAQCWARDNQRISITGFSIFPSEKKRNTFNSRRRRSGVGGWEMANKRGPNLRAKEKVLIEPRVRFLALHLKYSLRWIVAVPSAIHLSSLGSRRRTQRSYIIITGDIYPSNTGLYEPRQGLREWENKRPYKFLLSRSLFLILIAVAAAAGNFVWIFWDVFSPNRFNVARVHSLLLPFFFFFLSYALCFTFFSRSREMRRRFFLFTTTTTPFFGGEGWDRGVLIFMRDDKLFSFFSFFFYAPCCARFASFAFSQQ